MAAIFPSGRGMRRPDLPTTGTILTETTTTAAQPAGRPRGLFRSPAAKFFLIGLLILTLTIPLMMVWALTAEREGRRQEVIDSIARDWARPQMLNGPYLLVPVTAAVTEEVAGTDGATRRTVLQKRTAVFTPERLAVVGDAPAETRKLSIYEATVYTATLAIEGRFAAPDPSTLGLDVRSVDWARARLAIGLGDLAGIEGAEITVAGRPAKAEPGFGTAGDGAPEGINAAAPGAEAGFAFTVKLRLKGTGSLAVVPVGGDSEIRLASDWPHPGLQFGALPSERQVGPEGFSATWRIPALARNLPSAFLADGTGFWQTTQAAVGAHFTRPVDSYQLMERALKYALMFVAAVFGIVFVLELLSRKRIHLVQYTLVGLILVFFYVLLLALAEQIGFAAAYGIAAGATGLVIAAFTWTALESATRGLLAGAGQAVVFGLLYLILRLEDVALLAGAVTGFVALTAVLFATRRVDWSSPRTDSAS